MISSWNINGIRAVNGRGDLKKYIEEKDPDILCLNETKIDDTIVDKETGVIPKHYHKYFNCCKNKKGYSGVGIVTKVKPVNVIYDIGVPTHDEEGRTLTLEFEHFYLVACYVPNAGQKLERLSYRTKEWDPAFATFLNGLKAKKMTILCGDLNVCHTELDIFNPTGPKNRAGWTLEERKEFTNFLATGWVDSFRQLHPNERKYSYFSAKSAEARPENKGWRLDYFVVSNPGMKAVTDSDINLTVSGSDHQPIELVLDKTKLEALK